MIAHVSAILLLPVFEKSVIFYDFRAIVHSISTREDGDRICWKATARKRTVDDSMTYWFPWKHPMARRRGLEFGVFDQTPRKMGSSARRYGPRRSILFPPQGYNSQSIGLALRASPFTSFGAFPQKHAKCGLGPSGLAFRASQMPQPKFFAVSMSASRSRTCCARLRPCRV